MLYEGKVVRTVPNLGLAYLLESAGGRVIGFSISQLANYRGESFAEAGVILGAKLYFEATEDGRLTYVSGVSTQPPTTWAAAAGA